MHGATPLLAVDDDVHLLASLETGLGRHGYDVSVVRTGREGLSAVATRAPAVVVLDLGLPDVDGLEVTRRLRSYSNVPILVLSGTGRERHRIAAYEAGADDFIAKPCSLRELAARITAVLRRGGVPPPALPARMAVGAVEIDVVRRWLAVDGRDVRLTVTEWRIVEVLASRPGDAVAYADVIHAIWSPDHGDESRPALRAHTKSLRRKLGDDPRAARFVRTEPRYGLRWVAVADL